MSIGRFALALAFLLLLPAAVAAELPAQKHAQGEFSFATGPVPAFVQPHEVAPTWPAQEGKEAAPGWRNWLIDSQVDRRPGNAVAYHDNAFEAVTPELVAHAAKLTIEFNPLYQTLTIHRVELRRDGAWSNRFDAGRVSLARRESGFEQNLSDGMVSALVLLADVRAGDVVRFSYSIDGVNPIVADSDVYQFRLAWVHPILDRHVRLLHGAREKTDVRRSNTDLPVATRTVGDHKEITMHARRTAAMVDEGDYPVWYNRFPVVEIAKSRSWADVVSWALPLYPENVALPAELESRVQEWAAIADPHARAFAVLRTVQRDVRYFGAELGENTHRPTPPAVTWQRRYGDCKDKAYLTVALLRRLGIEAEPALVSTSQGRALLERLPAAAQFNHVIVAVHIGGRTLWLDPTRPEQRGDLRALDLRELGVALPVKAGQASLVSVQPPATPSNSVEIEETFKPNLVDDSIELSITTTYTGLRAEQMRWRMSSEGIEPLSRSFADYYRKRHSELSVAAPLAVEDASDGDRLVLRERYLLKSAWSEKLGTQRRIDLYADAISGDASLPDTIERNGPLALNRPSVLIHRTRVEVPKGWSMGELPAGSKVDGGEFAYQRKASATASTVTLEHRFDILSDHVPSARVAEYVRGLRLVRDELSSSVSLRVAQEAADSDRQQRLRKLLRDASRTDGETK